MDPDLPPAHPAPDDAAEHLDTLRSRLEVLERRFREQLEAEKLESLAEWAAGAGHEINNPLAVITGRAQLLARSEADPERRRELAVIRVQAQRVHEMIADLMLFARPPEPELQTCRLGPVIDEVLRELTPRADDCQVRLQFPTCGDPLEVEADPVQITVALRALLDNALQAAGTGGTVTIAAKCMGRTGPPESGPLSAARNWVEICVHDTGPGISPEVRRHLFDPFFSGRQAGRGLGMGLAKCWRIVTRHGGQVSVRSEPGSGATFVVRLPAKTSPQQDEPLGGEQRG